MLYRFLLYHYGQFAMPFVRPIVRGKTNAPVEFGAKLAISMVNGYPGTSLDRSGSLMRNIRQ